MRKLLRMALFAALPLAAMMMFSSYSGGSENNPCPPPGNDYYTVLVPVPGNCSSFYACSDGVPVLQHCPDGLHFNDELDTCEYPTDAGCEDGSEDGSGGGNSTKYPFSSRCNVAQSPNGGNRCKVTVISCQGSGYGCTPQKCPTHNHD